MGNKARKKIPRNALEPLMQTCEMLSKEWNKPATEIFRDFLKLMDRYADYFFTQPWPKKYNYKEATTFTDEDLDFLLEKKDELRDRYTAISLKKNINLEFGFQGYFGIFWTQQAFHEKFFRPLFKPVLEAFNCLAQKNNDAQSALNKLKEQFKTTLIHDSLVDLLEHEYPDESSRKLIGEIFELLHTTEGIPPCGKIRCDWYLRKKYPSQT